MEAVILCKTIADHARAVAADRSLPDQHARDPVLLIGTFVIDRRLQGQNPNVQTRGYASLLHVTFTWMLAFPLKNKQPGTPCDQLCDSDAFELAP